MDPKIEKVIDEILGENTIEEAAKNQKFYVMRMSSDRGRGAQTEKFMLSAPSLQLAAVALHSGCGTWEAFIDRYDNRTEEVRNEELQADIEELVTDHRTHKTDTSFAWAGDENIWSVATSRAVAKAEFDKVVAIVMGDDEDSWD